MRPSERLYRWRQFEAAQESERSRLTYLKSAPLPVTPPELLKPVRCKVIKSFFVSGKPLQPGEIVSLPWHLAQDMKALHKVEIL